MIANKKVNQIMNSFIIDVQKVLDGNILSIILFGSSVSDDFSFGYSDIDFLLVTKEEMTNTQMKQIIYLLRTYKHTNSDLKILEGYFLSYDLLVGKKHDGTQLFWNGIREQVYNHLSIDEYTMYQIKEVGQIIFGDDIRSEIKEINRKQMLIYIKNYVTRSKDFLVIQDEIHSIDWVFIFSSMIYYILNNKMKDKSFSALWVYQNIKTEFTQVIPKCIAIRQHPNLFLIPEYNDWVKTLEPAIKQFADYVKKLILEYNQGENE